MYVNKWKLLFAVSVSYCCCCSLLVFNIISTAFIYFFFCHEHKHTNQHTHTLSLIFYSSINKNEALHVPAWHCFALHFHLVCFDVHFMKSKSKRGGRSRRKIELTEIYGLDHRININFEGFLISILDEFSYRRIQIY